MVSIPPNFVTPGALNITGGFAPLNATTPFTFATSIPNFVGALPAVTAAVIRACVPALAISTPCPLPDAQRGIAYAQTLAATGGAPPYTWASVGGTVPPGLLLSNAGQLGGTPTVSGLFSFTLQVTDSAGQTDQESYTVNVG